MWPFKKKTAIIVHNRPVPDEEALKLVDEGVLQPHEAPMAMLRRLQEQQRDK